MADPISAAALISAAIPTATAASAAATAAATAGAAAMAAPAMAAANPFLGALTSGAMAGSTVNAALPSALSAASPAFVGPAAPTFMQSAINGGQNLYGLMGSNPMLTNTAMQAGSAMMQPPQQQVLQAPPIQSGQFAPVDFMSLLSPQNQQMPRRTSLLG